MKKRIAMFLAATMAAMCATADTETVDDYTWTYRIVNGGAEICNDDTPAISPKPTGAVTIPSTLGGKPVTCIGGFSGGANLTSVTIPSSVTSIGGFAFFVCRRLKEVHIFDIAAWCRISFADPTSNPLGYAHNLYLNGEKVETLTIPDSITSIGASAFFGCSGLTSATIPDSVTSIGYSAFSGCDGLKSVTIGNGVTNIGSSAFTGCSGLKSITIPDSVTSIESYAFSGCSRLASVTIPERVTSIGAYAFSGCNGLTSVTIPDSVTSIGSYAFSGCSGLTSVTIPDSVTNIESCVFRGCSDMMSITVDNGNANYTSITGLLLSKDGKTLILGVNGDVVIPNGVTSIGSYAFPDCSGLTSVMIPDSVTSIGYHAFRGCSGLTSVTIPNSVTSIGGGAFYECYGLTSMTIPDSVTSIGRDVFYKCRGLTNVTIPGSVTNIGEFAFALCWNLTNLTFRGDAPVAGESVFYHVGEVGDDFVAHVRVSRSSTGWGVDIPGTWNGMLIEYYDDVPPDTTVQIDGHDVTVAGDWLAQHQSLVEAAGGDTVAVLNAPAANGKRRVSECYALGVDPEDPKDDFKITSFEMVNGEPVFSFNHTEDGGGASLLPRIKKLGKADLGDKWQVVPVGGNPDFRFFTAAVELP